MCALGAFAHPCTAVVRVRHSQPLEKGLRTREEQVELEVGHWNTVDLNWEMVEAGSFLNPSGEENTCSEWLHPPPVSVICA